MKYVLTGATGFIGGRLVRQLLAAGHEVRALVRSPEKAQDLAGLGVKLYAGDITAKESLKAPLEGADGLFHVAAWYKVGAPSQEAEAINVGGTRNVLEAMREAGVPRGVYTSTLAVFSDTGGRLVDESYRYDGPHLSAYDLTKWKAHYEVALPMMREGLPLVIVQPGAVYGPGDHSQVHETFEQFLLQKLPLAPQRSALCWGHVDDTAGAHLLAMEKGRPGESYIIAGPDHTVVEALAIASSLTGIDGPCLLAPPALLKGASGLMSLVEKVVPVPEAYRAETLSVMAGRTYTGDNAKARRELGFAPRSLREGLRETLAHEMRRLGMKLPATLEEQPA